MNLYIDDRPNPKLGDIVAKSIKLKNQEPDLCAIFVDYVNIIKVDQPKESHSLEIADITSTLKELARNLKIPVIALSQINRDADKNENGEPSLSNLKDSGAIEQDADIVMLMYRKDYYDNQGKRIAKGMSTFEQKAEEQVAQAKAKTGDKDSISSTSVSIAKNRNGKTGKVTLLFSKALQRFDDISLEAEEAQRALDNNEGYAPSPDDE
jgi:replicative DNA helicase